MTDAVGGSPKTIAGRGAKLLQWTATFWCDGACGERFVDHPLSP